MCNEVSIADCIKTNSMSLITADLFKCHKEVHALPMTRGDYNEARGWAIPENENPFDDGYLVIYSRGTADEYVSWSPKGAFDNGYVKA